MALVSAGLASVAACLALHVLWELVTLLLACEADVGDRLGHRRRKGGIDRSERFQGAACGDEIVRRRGAGGHARVVHGEHAETVTQAVVAFEDAFSGGVAQSLVFGVIAESSQNPTLRRPWRCTGILAM